MQKVQPRTAWHITRAVWKALMLRESLTRLFGSRAAWFWLLAEPVFHVAYMLVIFTAVRVTHIGGIETPIWLMVGMLAFFMFRRTGTQAGNAISANRSLFTYRQVKPVDTVLVRAGLEGLLLLAVMAVLLVGLALLNYAAMPADPLAVMEAFAGLWLLGLGFGLVTSVAAELVPEIDRLIGFLMMPLYMVSGAILPLGAVPQPYRDWLLLNPVAHGLEAARLGFAPYYHAVPDLSLPYLYMWVLGCLFLGLALHRRFALRLATK